MLCNNLFLLLHFSSILYQRTNNQRKKFLQYIGLYPIPRIDIAICTLHLHDSIINQVPIQDKLQGKKEEEA